MQRLNLSWILLSSVVFLSSGYARSSDICAGYPNGYTLQLKTPCEPAYITCIYERSVKIRCPAGLTFSGAKGICNYAWADPTCKSYRAPGAQLFGLTRPLRTRYRDAAPYRDAPHRTAVHKPVVNTPNDGYITMQGTYDDPAVASRHADQLPHPDTVYTSRQVYQQERYGPRDRQPADHHRKYDQPAPVRREPYHSDPYRGPALPAHGEHRGHSTESEQRHYPRGQSPHGGHGHRPASSHAPRRPHTRRPPTSSRHQTPDTYVVETISDTKHHAPPRKNKVNRHSHKKAFTCPYDGYHANPWDCSRYFHCRNYIAYSMKCSNGTYFRKKYKHCSYDRQDCTQTVYEGVNEDTHESIPTENIVPNSQEESDGAKLQAQSLLRRVKRFLERADIRAQEKTIKAYQHEIDKAAFISNQPKRPFYGVNRFLHATPYSRALGYSARKQLECLKDVKKQFHLNNDQLRYVINGIGHILPRKHRACYPDMKQEEPTLTDCPYPSNTEDNGCDHSYRYRSFDGSCNNLYKPVWGKAFTPLKRLLSPDYADGIEALRTGKYNKPLPSARKVSTDVLDFNDNDNSPIHNMMMMTLGQLVDHDLDRTAVTMLTKEIDGMKEMVDVMCGDDGCQTEGEENRACAPIPIPHDDPFFTNKTCLMFVRTQEVMRTECDLGPREQLNQITAWIDASFVYGSSKEDADRLRDLSDPSRGPMKIQNHPIKGYKYLMPGKTVKACRGVNATVQCFDAGDGRNNEHIGLSALHTVFLREHNRLEEQLHEINPHWDGERLFQETRRIVAAINQHIIYNEYLPIVLGPREMQRFKLNVGRGHANVYSPETDPSVSNSFATAAFRFAHSQIADFMRLQGKDDKYENVQLTALFRRPELLYRQHKGGLSGIDAIIRGHITQPAGNVDKSFANSVHNNMFTDNPPHGMGTDLAALNTQRGRDHGLPGYNAWRRFCDLPEARSFDDLQNFFRDPNAADRLRDVYRHVDDIDLFVGGVLETHVSGGSVGRTFACIIGKQDELKVHGLMPFPDV